METMTQTALAPRKYTKQCKICGFTGYGEKMKEHYIENPTHRTRKAPGTRGLPEGGISRILAAKKEIQEAIKDMEFERNQHQQRILELDTQISEAKKIV